MEGQTRDVKKDSMERKTEIWRRTENVKVEIRKRGKKFVKKKMRKKMR